MPKPPVAFIHGLWLHASSWEAWMALFAEHGYTSINPAWPGDADTVEASREHPEAIANHGLKEAASAFADAIAHLPEKPVLIGHSFGGLLAQELLCEDVGVAGIAIDPAPIKGVWQLPFTALKASLPVLSHPSNLTKAVSLTFEEFVYGFANELSEYEARKLYDKYTIPAPGRPIFQAATATLNPHSETAVNVSNGNRGPLLVVSGQKDHIVPPVLAEATVEQYRESGALTELKSFAGRGHSLTIDHGWRDVAEYCLEWLSNQGL